MVPRGFDHIYGSRITEDTLERLKTDTSGWTFKSGFLVSTDPLYRRHQIKRLGRGRYSSLRRRGEKGKRCGGYYQETRLSLAEEIATRLQATRQVLFRNRQTYLSALSSVPASSRDNLTRLLFAPSNSVYRNEKEYADRVVARILDDAEKGTTAVGWSDESRRAFAKKCTNLRQIQSAAYERLSLWKLLRDNLVCDEVSSVLPYDAHEMMLTDTILALDSVVDSEDQVGAMYDPLYTEGYSLTTMFLVAYMVYESSMHVVEAYERTALSPCFDSSQSKWRQYYANALVLGAESTPNSGYARLREAIALSYNSIASVDEKIVDREWLEAWLRTCEANSRDYFPLITVSSGQDSFQQGIASESTAAVIEYLEENGMSKGLVKLCRLLDANNMTVVGPNSAYFLVNGTKSCESVIQCIQHAVGRAKSNVPNEIVNISFENGRVTCRPEFRAYALPHASIAKVDMAIETALVAKHAGDGDARLVVGESIDLCSACEDFTTRIDAFRGRKADQCTLAAVDSSRRQQGLIVDVPTAQIQAAEGNERTLLALSLGALKADAQSVVDIKVNSKDYKFVPTSRAFSATNMARFTSMSANYSADFSRTVADEIKCADSVDPEFVAECVDIMRTAHDLTCNRFETVDVAKITADSDYRVSMALEGVLIGDTGCRIAARLVVELVLSERTLHQEDSALQRRQIVIVPQTVYVVVSNTDGMF